MNFKETEDNLEDLLFCRRVSENGLVEVGVRRVIFGFRVVAGFVNSVGPELNWCAGAHWNHVEVLYSICVGILSKREENKNCFDSIPHVSEVKPFYNDVLFLQIIGGLAGNDCPPIRLDRTHIDNFALQDPFISLLNPKRKPSDSTDH